jgi:hypothetical protein
MKRFTISGRPRVGEVVRYPIEDGQAGINQQMIPRMIEAVRTDHANNAVRTLALEIVRSAGCGERDTLCMATAIYDYVNRHSFWIDDPVLEETLLWPRKFVEEMVGRGVVYADCASLNTAILSMLGAVGIRGAFVFAGDGRRDRGEPVFYHVFSMTMVNGKPFYMEPTLHLAPGKKPEIRYKETIVVDPFQPG